MYRMSLLFTLALMFLTPFFTGCSGPHYVDYFPYCDDGTQKPRVALVPVYDSSKAHLPWNLSQELTQGIRYQIMDYGNLYLLSRGEISPSLAKLNASNLFGPDLKYAKIFQDTDFVVIMELFQHDVIPQAPRGFLPSYGTLQMKMRLRIIDIRRETPALVLQEIVSSDQPVPKDIDQEINLIPYGTESYPRTPYGSSHQRFIDQVARRIEEITWGAK